MEREGRTEPILDKEHTFRAACSVFEVVGERLVNARIGSDADREQVRVSAVAEFRAVLAAMEASNAPGIPVGSFPNTFGPR